MKTAWVFRTPEFRQTRTELNAENQLPGVGWNESGCTSTALTYIVETVGCQMGGPPSEAEKVLNFEDPIYFVISPPNGITILRA